MADLDAAAAHEGQMLRPGFRAGGVHQPRHAVEPRVIDRDGGGEAERDAMQQHRHLRRQRAQRAELAPPRAEVILGDHLDDVDAVEMGENAGGELGPPAQAEAVVAQLPPHPPHPPPPPPPPPHPLLPQLEPLEEPQPLPPLLTLLAKTRRTS